MKGMAGARERCCAVSMYQKIRIAKKENEESVKHVATQRAAKLQYSHLFVGGSCGIRAFVGLAWLAKLEGFEQMSAHFPDPLGVGSSLSLALAIFGELVCSLAVVFGVLSRLALLPMIFTMCVAFFVAHGGSIAEGELAFVYLVVFVLLFFAGPGRFSVDGWLAKKLA